MTRTRKLVILLSMAASVAAFLPASSAHARTTRPLEGSVGTFGVAAPDRNVTVAVDQSNGDVYAVDADANRVVRFDSSGAPKNFIAGPGAGTNALTGFEFSTGNSADVAIDSSGGALDGAVYVLDPANGSFVPGEVKIFDRSGSLRGSLDGSGAGTPFGNGRYNACGVAVDQSNGDVYIGGIQVTWRYAPESPSGELTDGDFDVTGIEGGACVPAADSGFLYGIAAPEHELYRYAAADFAPPVPSAFGPIVPKADGALIDGPVPGISPGPTSVDIDAQAGQLYVNQGARQAVFQLDGTHLYRFGHASESGVGSTGIAVESSASGEAKKVYVADGHFGGGELDVYGPTVQVPTYSHVGIAAFGPDGTGNSSFEGQNELLGVAFDEAARRVYAIDGSVPGIRGFDAESPPEFPLLAGFDPLEVAPPGNDPGLAVDNTGLGSTGNVYLASQSTDLLYGFDDSGSPLSGFPVDPASSPGAPAGSPKDLCGTAVDSEGHVWVSNAAASRILEYTAAGAYLSAIDTSVQGKPCALSFDGEDNLYAAIADNGVNAGAWKYAAASGYTTVTRISQGAPRGIAVDLDSGHVYLAYRNSNNQFARSWVDEYDAEGEFVDEFAIGPQGARFAGITADSVTGDVYVADPGQGHVRVLGPPLLLPEIRASAADGVSNSAATLRGAVNSQGLAVSDCYFEYVTEDAFRTTGFTDLGSGGSVPCDPEAAEIPVDLDEHAVSASLEGLERNTTYRFRLLAANGDGSVATEQLSFITSGPPEVETVGAPIRGTSGARLEGRVNPRGAATTFHFEYGDQGPCDANPCQSTEARPLAAGQSVRFVSEAVAGLAADTTYHYRVLAENGNEDGVSSGDAMAITTRATDTLEHGHLAGPPGSDRAWEQVNLAETSGNPIVAGLAFSDSGNRAVYQLAGGTPETDSGSGFNQLFAERGVGGWKSRQALPPRDEIAGPNWFQPVTSPDLSAVTQLNFNVTTSEATIWRLRPDGAPTALFDAPPGSYGSWFSASEDGSRTVVALEGSIDPSHPAPEGTMNLYEIGGGTPRLVSLLPDGSVPTCGTQASGAYGLPLNYSRESERRLSPDGGLLFFPSPGNAASCGNTAAQIYVRDFAAEETRRVSPPALSGPTCGAAFIKSTPGAVFFWSGSRLTSDDSASVECPSGVGSADADVYRYEVSTEALDCVSCAVPGVDADVWVNPAGAAAASVAVAQNGSRVYFRSPNSLLAGAAAPGAYRVDVESGELAYVAPLGESDRVGGSAAEGNALNPDGSVLVFRSSLAGLNQVGGAQNGGTAQYYRYDDRDRSLICVSCPPDGSAAGAAADSFPPIAPEVGRNVDPLDDGGAFAFSTPVPLSAGDQNTAEGGEAFRGTDVYEWRDGRVLLVTDGKTRWPNGEIVPVPNGFSPDGRDLFFTAAAQLTPDALDGNNRLYDARIGGGFEFPEPPEPCSLEDCQGDAEDAPAAVTPGSAAFVGPGNAEAALPGGRCTAPARQAKRLSRRAKRFAKGARRLRRGASRASGVRRATALRSRAQRLAGKARRNATKAKHRSGAAKRCRARQTRLNRGRAR